MSTRGPQRVVSGRTGRVMIAALAIVLAGAPIGLAQVRPGGVFGGGGGMQGPIVNPVYMDDSPAANDALVRVREHIAAGNLDEAVRVLQQLIDEHGERAAVADQQPPTVGDGGQAAEPVIFVSVRARAMAMLRSSPEVLERYERTMEPRAKRELDDGNFADVERTLWLTPSGLDAALRLANRAFEDARFDATAIMLAEIAEHPQLKGQRAAAAKRIADELAEYVDRPDVQALHARLAQPAGDGVRGKERPPLRAWPASATRRGVSPVERPAGQAGGTIDGLVSKPVWSVQLTGGPGQSGAGG